MSKTGGLSGFTAVMYNLKDFSVINRNIGFEGGNEVMKAHYETLRDMIGERGAVCRVGGDNFAYKNPELVRIINEQYLRGAAALEEGLDKETAERIAEYMKLDEEQIDKLLPKFKYTVDVTQEDIDSLNDTIGFLYKEKQIPEVYDISEYVSGQK